MKKLICTIDVSRINCKKGEIYNLTHETDNYWVIKIGNSEHYISKFFGEFMLLSDNRKLKLKKINNEK